MEQLLPKLEYLINPSYNTTPKYKRYYAIQDDISGYIPQQKR